MLYLYIVMASVAKWLRQWIVVPPFVGSSPIVRPCLFYSEDATFTARMVDSQPTATPKSYPLLYFSHITKRVGNRLY